MHNPAMSWLSEIPARNRLSPLLQYNEKCPSAVWYENLINHNWASIKSTLFHGMPFFSMITTHKAQVWILNARCKCIFPNIKHFDDMALTRVKTAIAYAARRKIVTSAWLYTAGINIIFWYTTLSSEPLYTLPPKCKHYSDTALIAT